MKDNFIHRALFAWFILFLIIVCNGQHSVNYHNKQEPEVFKTDSRLRVSGDSITLIKKQLALHYANTKFTTLISKSSNSGFGYFIFADGQLIIDQKVIPALSGNQTFVSEKDAMLTASLAAKKIKQGEMPPTIRVDELRKLKITASFPPEKPIRR